MLSFKRFAAYLAKGVLPEMTALDEALAEHDKRFHPDGYREGDRCNRREGMAKGDRADAGVSAVPKRHDVEKTSFGYVVRDGGRNVGVMDISEGYGDEIASELYESTGVELPQIAPMEETVYVEDLSVQKQFRGRGIAKGLMERLIKDYGDRQIVLRAFDTGGESEEARLVDFYSRYGFKPICKTDDSGVVMVRSKVAREGKSVVSAEEDAAYLDAVEKGDLETAQRMVREAAAKAMPDTKVVDEDGLPKVVYHTGTFGGKHTVPEIGREGMHFGTKQAADDRKGSKLAEELRARQHVGAFRASDGLWYYTTDKFGPHEYNSYEAGAEGWESAEEAMKAGEESLELEAENSSQGDYGFSTTSVFLNITNPHKNRDEGTYWGGVVRRSKESGSDGIEYENMFEDRGSRSYIAFQPSQIKSADAVTYDDARKPIPLSRRFDFSSDDIRY